MRAVQAELVSGAPLFDAGCDVDQLYEIEQIIGPLVAEHRLLFEHLPEVLCGEFSTRKEPSLDERCSGRVSSGALSFLKGLLHVDPRKRLTAHDALRHEYLQQQQDEDRGSSPGGDPGGDAADEPAVPTILVPDVEARDFVPRKFKRRIRR